MSNNNPIFTLTINPCLDISAEVDKVRPTRKMRCRNERLDPGGGGINVSRAIKILGGTSTAFFPSGGSTGEIIVEMLREQGVASQVTEIEQMTRQSFAVRENDSDQQYRFALPGPELDERSWQNCLQHITEATPSPAMVVASGSLPPGVPSDFYGKLAKRISNGSSRLILDTSGEPLKQALAANVYLIKPNQRELEDICQCSLDDYKVQEDKCREIVDQGSCEVLVLTLGAKGALLTTREEQIRVPGLEVEAVSAVGAGDCLVGAMTLALHQGRNLKDAFFYGMAAGTAALTTEATILCRKEETEKLYQQLLETHGNTSSS